MNTIIPAEVRGLARMINCPMCHGEGKTGGDRVCAFCGGDKLVKRSVVNQIAREQHETFEKFCEEIGA